MKIAAKRTFREIQLGEIFHIRRCFSPEDVDRFAQLSGDFSPLHMDPDYADRTEFGGRVVHGVLLASLFSQLVGMHVVGKYALYMGQDLAFRRPVLIGEELVASAKVTGKNATTRTISLATEIRNVTDQVVVAGTARVKVRDTEPIALVTQPDPTEMVGEKRVVLITGASRGIGAEIARVLSQRNMRVIVNYNASENQAQQLVAEIAAHGGEAEPFRADVRQRQEVEHMFQWIASRFGRLDALVNGAIGDISSLPAVELEWQHFNNHLEYQLQAVFQVCKSAYPYLKAHGGSIVNILSQVTSGPPPTMMADYVAAKYALKGLSRALAAEWAVDGIRLNTVSPGLTQTELTQHMHERIFKMEASRTPLKRLAQPSDVAQTVAFLLSDEASFLTGVDVPITGGQVMN